MSENKEMERIITTSSLIRGLIWVPAEVKKLLRIQGDDKILWIQRNTVFGSEIILRNNRQEVQKVALKNPVVNLR